VLPDNVTARVSVEAGVTFGWSRYVGDAGASVGLDRYGASAPGAVAMKELGFTPENVVRTVRELLGR
jgi:transketolase